MSTQVELVAEATVEEVQQVSTIEVSPVVDRGLVAQLVGDARSRGSRSTGRAGCSRS